MRVAIYDGPQDNCELVAHWFGVPPDLGDTVVVRRFDVDGAELRFPLLVTDRQWRYESTDGQHLSTRKMECACFTEGKTVRRWPKEWGKSGI